MSHLDEFVRNETMPLPDFQRLEATCLGNGLKSGPAFYESVDSGPVEQRTLDCEILSRQWCQRTGPDVGEYEQEYLSERNNWIPLSDGGREVIPDTS